MTNETTASQPKSIGDDAVIERAIRFIDTGSHTQIARDTMTNELRKVLASHRAPPDQASAIIQAAPDWKLGTWFEARTLDEMEAFYMSRLPMIREAAKEHGYAIGLHGTARRDFDLMAMQWRADASDKDSLARAIADAACGIRREGSYDWEKKPMGRVATSIPVCWTDHSNPDFDKPSVGHIDLSIIELAATIQEPVMVAEPVGVKMLAAGDKAEPQDNADGAVAVVNLYPSADGEEKTLFADLLREVPEGTRLFAAPMVADPAGVADESGLDHLERLARAATQGRWEYGCTPVASPKEAVDICRDNIHATEHPTDQFYEVFLMNGLRTALIGNGPTSAANAEYIASLHPANILHLISLARRAATVKAVPSEALTGAALDVLAERRRQVETEGYDSAHDDQYKFHEMTRAAICYIRGSRLIGSVDQPVDVWPWGHEWWKPGTHRRNLVKASALVLAEIERIDRAAPLADKTGGAA